MSECVWMKWNLPRRTISAKWYPVWRMQSKSSSSDISDAFESLAFMESWFLEDSLNLGTACDSASITSKIRCEIAYFSKPVPCSSNPEIKWMNKNEEMEATFKGTFQVNISDTNVFQIFAVKYCNYHSPWLCFPYRRGRTQKGKV